MKKEGIVVVIFLIVILSLSLVSASWFTDFWNKITGKVEITGNVISEENFVAYWKLDGDIKDTTDNNHGTNYTGSFV